MTQRLNDVTPAEHDAVNYYKKLDEKLPDDYWDESRIDTIGQNGNTGEHYLKRDYAEVANSVSDTQKFIDNWKKMETTANNAVNKYKVKLKGVEFDVYDVLYAFHVTNPAVQHAVKKLLKAGDRGFKGREQDLREAIHSIERAVELENE